MKSPSMGPRLEGRMRRRFGFATGHKTSRPSKNCAGRNPRVPHHHQERRWNTNCAWGNSRIPRSLRMGRRDSVQGRAHGGHLVRSRRGGCRQCRCLETDPRGWPECVSGLAGCVLERSSLAVFLSDWLRAASRESAPRDWHV